MTTHAQTHGPGADAPMTDPTPQVVSPGIAKLFAKALDRRHSSILRTCLSCGAQGVRDQQLPCKH